ncbi:hypothetical protein MTR67_031935 [Solanum verrucosum]|uniref:Glucan endo-1,3-beta-D-glucosidase n=1 Tax=Solanum verrucosum TaxID=315347 RepID=A0AAF0U3F4_SOLVR|nr:hypothetical protein MTR67_031935 [Solanum verrucosum]
MSPNTGPGGQENQIWAQVSFPLCFIVFFACQYLLFNLKVSIGALVNTQSHYDTLKGLGNAGIEVMVGIPNDMLITLGSFKAAEKWVSNNISAHLLTTMRTSAGHGNQVKVIVPLNSDVYESSSSLPLVLASNYVKYLEKKWCVLKPNAKLDDPSVSYACVDEACKFSGLGTITKSDSIVAGQNLLSFKKSSSVFVHKSCITEARFSWGRRKSFGSTPNAKKKYSKKKSWWRELFFVESGNWLGLREDDMIDGLESEGLGSDDELSENEKFEAWKRRAEAIMELREAQEDIKNEENRKWDDWLVDVNVDLGNDSSWVQESIGVPEDNILEDPSELIPGRGLVKSVRDMILGREEDDMLYEDRIFQYASLNSAKFLALLIIVPWALDFVVHDYVLMPFLDR